MDEHNGILHLHASYWEPCKLERMQMVQQPKLGRQTVAPLCTRLRSVPRMLSMLSEGAHLRLASMCPPATTVATALP
jgi:hypothetical protein